MQSCRELLKKTSQRRHLTICNLLCSGQCLLQRFGQRGPTCCVALEWRTVMRHPSRMSTLAIGCLIGLVLGASELRGAWPSPICSSPACSEPTCLTKTSCRTCDSSCCEDVWAGYCEEKQRTKAWLRRVEGFLCGPCWAVQPGFAACSDGGPCCKTPPVAQVVPLPAPLPVATPDPPRPSISKVEATPPPKVEPLPPLKVDIAPPPKTESTPAPKTEVTPAPKTESTPAPKVESTPAPKTESTPAPKVESPPPQLETIPPKTTSRPNLIWVY